MRTGTVAVAPGELDLETTLEVGQTFTWHKASGENLYTGEGDTYYTTRDGNVLVLEQTDAQTLEYRATGGMEQEIERRFRLHESLQDITDDIEGKDPLLDQAMDTYPGLRVMHDDIFPCLISYLCSVQMRIPRIKQLYDTLAETYGTPITVNGNTYLQFPTLQQLADATEDDLRELGVGYRAKYIAETTNQLMREEVVLDELQHMTYTDAHDEIKQLHGVGDKVADCVLLFGAGHLDAFPIDTWIRKTVKQHYPELHDEQYHVLADNFRQYIGSHVGYAQEYLFHYVRNNTSDQINLQ